MSRSRLAPVLLVVAACGGPAGPTDASLDAADRGPDARVEEIDTGAGEPDAGLASPDSPPPLEPDAGSDAGPRCPERPRLGFFVWTDDLVPQRDALLDLAADHGVTEIYLHANLFYSGDIEEDVLALWIATAHERCMDVELLFGDAAWTLPAGHDEAIQHARWAAGYAMTHPEARPSGVHFDIEPHGLAGWRTESNRPSYVSSLVDVLEAMTPITEAAGVPLSADIGFFLDGVTLTRGGVTRPGHEWVTDAVSRVVIMDYRDTATGGCCGSMISLAEDEVAYAATAGTPIVLAVETQALPEGYATFREEGRAEMFRVIDEVRAHFGADVSGFAIHDDGGLAALGP